MRCRYQLTLLPSHWLSASPLRRRKVEITTLIGLGNLLSMEPVVAAAELVVALQHSSFDKSAHHLVAGIMLWTRRMDDLGIVIRLYDPHSGRSEFCVWREFLERHVEASTLCAVPENDGISAMENANATAKH